MSLQLDITHQHQHFSLTIKCQFPATGISGIFGHSGSGKTTLLRCIAGLESNVTGGIHFHGQQWLGTDQRVKAEFRKVGMVFQDSRLFPHLTVLRNLTLAQDQVASPTINLAPLCHDFGLTPLLNKPANLLSSGQQQRVAIVRSLLAEPDLLLLDEPLSALDMPAKELLIPLIKQISEQHNLPMIYVSHSAREISQLCDKLLIMEHGTEIDFGSAQTLLKQRGYLGQQGKISHIDKTKGTVTIELSPDELANLSTQTQVYLLKDRH